MEANFTAINMSKTGERISRLMEDNGLTVRDIQDVMGFRNPQTVYKWRRGASIPSVDNLVLLGRLFGSGIDGIIVTDDRS